MDFLPWFLRRLRFTLLPILTLFIYQRCQSNDDTNEHPFGKEEPVKVLPPTGIIEEVLTIRSTTLSDPPYIFLKMLGEMIYVHSMLGTQLLPWTVGGGELSWIELKRIVRRHACTLRYGFIASNNPSQLSRTSGFVM